MLFLAKRAGARKMEEPCPDKSAFAQAEQAHIATKEKQSVPDGERSVNLIVCGFLQGASGSRVPIKQYLQKLPKWGRFGVASVTPFLLLPVHPEGCTPAHRT